MDIQYKTDESIKEFIDSVDVITMRELIAFMYPYADKKSLSKRGYSSSRIARHWDYVLKTKNWSKIKNHINYKIKNGNFKTEQFNKYKEIYMSDGRIRSCGTRRAKRLLMNIYRFDLSRGVILTYNKRINDDI